MPTVVTGTLALIFAATGWLMGIIPAGGGLMAGYHWFVSSVGAGGDELVAAQHKRAGRNTLIRPARSRGAARTPNAGAPGCRR